MVGGFISEVGLRLRLREDEGLGFNLRVGFRGFALGRWV